jgi:hypothetical protein
MRRSRLSRTVYVARKVRMHAVADEPYIREGFQEGLKDSSNKHIVQYSKIPDEVTRVDPFARILKEEAIKEIVYRNTLLKRWGHETPVIGFPEKMEDIAGTLESRTRPTYHFYKSLSRDSDFKRMLKTIFGFSC